MNYRSESPELLWKFLNYHDTVKGHSKLTVEEYFLDLRMFFRFLLLERGRVPEGTPMDEISILPVDRDLLASVTLNDIYAYLNFLANERETNQRSSGSGVGLKPTTRARKISAIKSLYKYLTVKEGVLTENPVKDLDSPKILKTLPRYLSEDESIELLSNIDGAHKERDFCIITIFLNCGLRISELVGLNLADVRADHLKVMGKGGKERVVFLNDACCEALNDYLLVRRSIAALDNKALFLSGRRSRISKSTVHNLVKKHLEAAGLDSSKYSAHKLRHTAATLMLHNGVDVRTLQELLGHEHLNTTEIYTHVESGNLREAARLSPLASFKRDEEKETAEEE